MGMFSHFLDAQKAMILGSFTKTITWARGDKEYEGEHSLTFCAIRYSCAAVRWKAGCRLNPVNTGI